MDRIHCTCALENKQLREKSCYRIGENFHEKMAMKCTFEKGHKVKNLKHLNCFMGNKEQEVFITKAI